METNNIQFVPIDQEETTAGRISFTDIWHKCMANWYWFLISVAVCLFFAAVYILRTRPTYGSSATVLIKEASARRVASSDIESVINFSGGTMSSKVVNEVIAFKSPALMMSVVDRLDLNTEYAVKRLLRTDVIYGTQVPVHVQFLDIPNNVTAKFILSEDPGKGFNIGKLQYQQKKDKFKVEGVIAGQWGDTLSTAVGHIIVTRNEYYEGDWKKPVYVCRRTTGSTTGMLLGGFKAEQEDVKNKSDVLNISIVDPSVQRGLDVLNMMITIYNENWVEDKNRMAVSTTTFIDERLVSLQKELGDVDQDISTYKSSHLIPDSRNVSDILLQEGRDNAVAMRELESKLFIFRYLRTFLANNPGTDAILPMSGNFGTHGIGEQIAEYNKTLLLRNNLQANSSDKNPVVIDLSETLLSMRKAVEVSIDNQVASLEMQIEDLKRIEDEATDKIASTPSQTQYLTSIGRQQKVKESLYLYLLQKREENELSQAFTAYNTRIITPPMAKIGATSPKKKQIALIALFLGLMIPLFVIYIVVLLDTKVRTKKEIENMTVPFLGEIPQYNSGRRGIFTNFFKPEDATEVLVKEGKRDIVNEAFRVMRTNLEFMTREQKCPVMIVTSYQPGSGKTFLSINTSKVMAIKGKKVLAIDGDMRHASLSEFVSSPKKGLSNYLSGENDAWQDAIVKFEGTATLDIIPAGTIPPNPAELISSPRFVSLLEEAKTLYDYIFIDCPPIDIVADTQVIQELADRTIFVARAGLLEKAMLPKIEKMNSDKKFRNLCLVLNGTSTSNGIYGSHGGYYNSSYNYYGLKG